MNARSRSHFLASAAVAASAAVKAVNAQAQLVPIIDTHIHLFDQTSRRAHPMSVTLETLNRHCPTPIGNQRRLG